MMNLSRITWLAIFPLLLLATPGAADAQAPAAAPKIAAKPATAPSKDAAAIDALFKSAVKPGEPGLAAIVVRKGQTLYRAAFGLANVELGVPLQPNHVFRIGPVTKQFTSAAIMMLRHPWLSIVHLWKERFHKTPRRESRQKSVASSQ